MENILEEKQKINVSQSRFSDAPWFETEGIGNSIITIGGAGGIGSWTAILLSRIGFPIYLYDDDTVEEVNIAGQFYNTNLIGVSKVRAVKTMASSFSAVSNITAMQERITEDVMLTNYMFSCFDNMEARKVMFEVWSNGIDEGLLDEKTTMFIDGRMEAEVAQIYFVTPEKRDRYRETLFDDSAVPELNCSYKSTSHNGAIIGGLITSGFLNHITNIKFDHVIRIVPFCIEYELPLLSYTKTM